MMLETLLLLVVLSVLLAGGYQAVLARKRRAGVTAVSQPLAALTSVPLWDLAPAARQRPAPSLGRPCRWEGTVPSKSRAEDVLDWLEANGWQRFEVSLQPDGVFLVRAERHE